MNTGSGNSRQRSSSATRWRRALGTTMLVLVLMFACTSCKPDRGVGEKTPSGLPRSAPALLIFAGAASQPATTEVIRNFEQETGIQVECTFGGSGAMLNQMRMEQIGDVYLPGSNDYMDVAERDGLVQPQTRRIICYLIPAICVAKGNPRSIAALPDLAQPKLKVSIGDPGSVCLGTIARTLLRDAGVLESVTKNIVTYASDCQQLATLVRLQEVDAIIGYDVFTRQSPKQMDLVPIPNAKALHIPVAVGRYSKASETAMRFVTYISSAKGKKVFAKYGYALTAN